MIIQQPVRNESSAVFSPEKQLTLQTFSKFLHSTLWFLGFKVPGIQQFRISAPLTFSWSKEKQRTTFYFLGISSNFENPQVTNREKNGI